MIDARIEPIAVAPLAAEDEAAFDAWLATVDEARIYADPAFIRCLASITGGTATYLVARRDSSIAGALAFVERTHAEYGRVVNSLPWYGSHGGCTLADAADDEVRRALLGAYRRRALGDGLLTATMVLTHGETRYLESYAASLVPRETDDRIGQVTELPAGGPGLEARLEATMLQKTRNLVRKSLRQGFREIVTDEEWAWRFLHDTHVENMRAVGGRPKPWQHFAVFRDGLPENQRRLSIALLDDLPVAALLLFRFNRTVEYITPVCVAQYRPLQPLSFLIWHGWLGAVETGARWWNWGGTWRSQHTLHHFKAGWGAQDEPYAYLICAADDAVDRLRQASEEIWRQFEFFYLYPFDRLSCAETAPSASSIGG